MHRQRTLAPALNPIDTTDPDSAVVKVQDTSPCIGPFDPNHRLLVIHPGGQAVSLELEAEAAQAGAEAEAGAEEEETKASGSSSSAACSTGRRLTTSLSIFAWLKGYGTGPPEPRASVAAGFRCEGGF